MIHLHHNIPALLWCRPTLILRQPPTSTLSSGLEGPTGARAILHRRSSPLTGVLPHVVPSAPLVPILHCVLGYALYRPCSPAAPLAPVLPFVCGHALHRSCSPAGPAGPVLQCVFGYRRSSPLTRTHVVESAPLVPVPCPHDVCGHSSSPLL